jgi:hypothetical protein
MFRAVVCLVTIVAAGFCLPLQSHADGVQIEGVTLTKNDLLQAQLPANAPDPFLNRRKFAAALVKFIKAP